MEIKGPGFEHDGVGNATSIMESGDHLSLAFIGLDGNYQVVNVMVQGKVMVINHEQSDDSMVITSRKTNFVAGGDK